MDINIKTIPYKDMRYQTCGDYLTQDNKTNMSIAKLPDEKYEYLVAIHELIEMILCKFRNIKDHVIDQWDLLYQGEGEPGNDQKCPYYKEHYISTVIERIIAHELNVDWNDYEKAINALDD